MKIIDTITLTELRSMAERMYGTMVKADVDVAQQADLWGINLYPNKFGTDEFIEFDSMINIRPRQNNPSRDVLDPTVRQQIIDIIAGVVRE